MMPHCTILGRIIFCAIFSVSLVNIFTSVTSASYFHRQTSHHGTAHHQDSDPICPHSPLLDNILLVLRTGATESLEKIPIHLRTTLQCVPHYTLVSDMSESISSNPIHNILTNVTEETRTSNPDFKLYTHLQLHGRTDLPSTPVLTSQSGSYKGDYTQTDKPGWSLDKWKFLPMVTHALAAKPDAKWFVFSEPDTYISLPNLVSYLSTFNPDREYYIGKHLFINDIAFAYGGAGIVLSAPAARRVDAVYRADQAAYEAFTGSHWVGDCALGKVAEDAGIGLHRAFPHFQGDSPATLDPATRKIERGLWCYPAVSFHHVSPAEMQALWAFEQEWARSRGGVVMRHRDVFMDYVFPQTSAEKMGWDNLASESSLYTAHEHAASAHALERDAWKSFGHCRELCESREGCLQFSFDAGSCGVSTTFRLGYASNAGKMKSGWMLDRVEDLFRGLEDGCGVRDWFSPDEDEGEGGERAELKRKMRRKRGV